MITPQLYCVNGEAYELVSPRFIAIMVAWVRSFAPNLLKMRLMFDLTVFSVIVKATLISKLQFAISQFWIVHALY
jgi:hypothetical protein